MTQVIKPIFQTSPYLPNLSQQRQQKLLGAFWLIFLALIIYELFWVKTSSLLSNFGAIFITSAALLPSYLWCSGRAQGLPIFPFFALTFIWSYALPLVNDYHKIIIYSPANHFFAGQTVAGLLILGTFVWFQFVKRTPQTPKFYRVLGSQLGNKFFLTVLFLSVFFNISNSGGWLLFLNGGLFSILTGVIIALTGLSVFVLAYRFGSFELPQSQGRLFVLLLAAYMITNILTLLLVSSTSVFLVAVVAFIIGRKKIPVLPIIIVLVCLSLLHYGKGEMRSKYWFSGQTNYVQPWEYPARYAEWIGYSIDIFNRQDNLPDSKQSESFIERSSMVHMLMLAQQRSPETKPFLYGKTYEIIPELLIPRFLNTNKIRSHEGTHILSVHYGLQKYKDTLTTTISWGLVAESYANFGLLGCAGLGVVLGTIYGMVTRWSINAPIISAQSLLAVLMMTFALQTEWTVGVYVVALAQSFAVLAVIVIFFMKTYRVVNNFNVYHS